MNAHDEIDGIGIGVIGARFDRGRIKEALASQYSFGLVQYPPFESIARSKQQKRSYGRLASVDMQSID